MSFTNHNKQAIIYNKKNIGNNVAPNYINTIFSIVDCTLNQLNSRRVIRSEGDKILADHIIYIDYIDGIEKDFIFQIDENEYYIYRIHNPNELNHHLEVYCLLKSRGTEIGDS